MCFNSGGSSGPKYQPLWDPDSNAFVWAEQGVPLEYAKRGITSVTQYQVAAQQDLSDKQIAAQKQIADQQNAFNQQQFDYQKQLATQQQQRSDAQAQRQSEYDTGRAQALGEGTKSVDQAFAQFSPDYFNKYASDYMTKVKDQLGQQKTQAQKQLSFGLARQGILDSQASANAQGLMAETEGRTLADATADAQNQANQLRQNVASAKNSLLGQVQASQSIGSPIAASDEGSVQQALQTQRNAISGIANQAGDVTASLKAVPTVSPLANIFANMINAVGSYQGGVNQRSTSNYFNRGLTGTDYR